MSLRALGAFGLLILAGMARAATPEALFAAGNAAFASGDYVRAGDQYSQALDVGGNLPAVYYNLGCACFARKQLGEAVLAFERAKLYNPRFADLNHNLALIREQFLADQDLVKPAGGLRGAVDRLVGDVTENEWIVLVSVLFWLTAGSLWLRWMLAHPLARLLALYACLTLGFLLLVGGYLCAVKIHYNLPETRAIVLASELPVQQAPDVAGGKSSTLFRLHAGAEVRVEDRRADWLFVRLPNGAAGWASERALGFVRPRNQQLAKAFLSTQRMGGKESHHDDQKESGNPAAFGSGAHQGAGGQ